MKNFLQGIILIIVAYLLISYADTEEFQAVMDALFAGNTPFFPDRYWFEERLSIIGMVVLLLILYYFPTWGSYRYLIKTYNNKSLITTRPALTTQQANYIYRQDKLATLKTWLLDCCQSGFLSLHYKKGANPWTIKRNPAKIPPFESEQKLINILFAGQDEKSIRDYYSEPDPQFEQAANQLFQQTKTSNAYLMHRKSTSFLAWFILVILLFEIPFLNSRFPDAPAMIMLCLIMTASTALFVSTIAYNFQSFFNNSKLIAYLVASLTFFIAIIIHYFILHDFFNMSYFYVQFHLDVVISIAILVQKQPALLKDNFLLEQVIGYQNYLQNKRDGINADELIWVLALEADVNLLTKYQSDKQPKWLFNYDDSVRVIIPELQNSLITSLNNAIYGVKKHKSRMSRNRTMMGDKY